MTGQVSIFHHCLYTGESCSKASMQCLSLLAQRKSGLIVVSRARRLYRMCACRYDCHEQAEYDRQSTISILAPSHGVNASHELDEVNKQK